jgi:putative spermidine/putrescine transport system permease protein
MAAPATAMRTGARRGLDRYLPVLFVAPITLAMLAFFVWPLLESVVNSFHPNTTTGIDRSIWTLANYGKLVDPFYLGVLWRTFRVSIVTTLLTAVLAFPVAWYITGLKPRAQAYWLLLFVAPWLVNVAVKAFGWSLILGVNGIINRTLRNLDLIGPPLRLMFNETGIVIGLLHGHFMFVLLPLWAALANFDRSLIWAAGNLGATPRQTFTRIVLPLTLPALMAGMIINFTMNMAAFATPALLGGSRARVISYLAYEVNLVDLNWPLGAAMAMVLLIVTMAIIHVGQRVTASGKRKVIFS